MAMGVLTENQTVWDFAVDYFKQGDGTGAINNAISNIVEEPGTGTPLGQGQESGRDQGHSALNIQLLAAIGQQAWNQGEDLFGFHDSRILRGSAESQSHIPHPLPTNVSTEQSTGRGIIWGTTSPSSLTPTASSATRKSAVRLAERCGLPGSCCIAIT